MRQVPARLESFRTLLRAVVVLLFVSSACALQAQTPVKVIFDTDMDLDVDDAGALAVLHALADNGEAEILGVICDAPAKRNGNTRLGAATISAINQYYQRPGIPIGDMPVSEYVNDPLNFKRYRNYGNSFADPGDPDEDRYVYYNESIKANFPNANISATWDGVTLYRKLLAEAPDNSVVIIAVGLLTMVEDLMYTGGDKYSSLTGKQLIAKKVKRLVFMSGERIHDGNIYYTDGFNSSFEGRGDAGRISLEWPTPIVIMPLGGGINTGARLTTETPVANPVRKAYEVFLGHKPTDNRSSWDQLAVIYGIRGNGIIFNQATNHNLEINWVGQEDPTVVKYPIEYFYDALETGDHNDILLSKKSTITNEQVARYVEDLMVQAPKGKYSGTFEAEGAKLQGAFFATSQPNHSGTGFADYANTTGDYIEWQVHNPTGSSKTVHLKFFYANGGGANRPLRLDVNGTQAGSNLPFSDTGGWSTWLPQTATATLAAGTNTIRLSVTGVHGPNVDYLAYEILQSGTLQAEDAVLSGVTFSNYNAGYTGTGYGNYNNINTDYIEWTVNKANAGTVSLRFRYANGYSTNRPLKLTVNGTVVASSLAFNPSVSWTDWLITRGPGAGFVAGNNKVRLTATDVMGVNMDYLSFTSSPSASPTARMASPEALAGRAADQLRAAVFPNPARGKARLTVSSPSEEALDIEVISLTGRVYRKLSHAPGSTSAELEIPVGGLAPGLYLIRVRQASRLTTTRLLVE